MIKKVHIIVFAVSSVVFIQNSFSQNFGRVGDWKKCRREILLQAGVSGFLGDLGGLDDIGTHLSPIDMEIDLTKQAISLAYRYKFFKNFAFHTSFNYLTVAGDDKLTKEPFRQNRNLNFKSDVFEVATRAELCLMSAKIGHRYGIKKTMSRRHKSRSWEFIAFVGIGAFYFEPKGLNASGEYVNLRPLHTEGQGLPGGPAQYKNIAISIPMGFDLRIIFHKFWSVGIEYNFRKTFTDYIDDVSTIYYDNQELKKNYGVLSSQMANPTINTIPDATSTDYQRGNSKNMDSYMSFQFTVGRFFPPKRHKARLRSKF